MKHFINKEMLAPNVMTIPVDTAIVDEFASLDYRETAGFQSVSPGWNSDIEWIAPATREAHGIFQSAFERLGIADHVRPYVDVEDDVRMYAGFMVVRSKCTADHFHFDWANSNNEGFTLLTPVSDNGGEFGMLYTKMTGETGVYEYRRGEAIVFGDYFKHSTRPGESAEPVVLLCFAFGSDKMEHWEKLRRTIGRQSGMVRRPDGEFVLTKLADRAAY